MKDFSIKEEVKVIMEGVTSLEDFPITVDEVVEEVQSYEVFLSMICLCISESISAILEDKGYENQDIEIMKEENHKILMETLVDYQLI